MSWTVSQFTSTGSQTEAKAYQFNLHILKDKRNKIS